MKPYTVFCNGHEINLTDKYQCAFNIGSQSVVVDYCNDCQLYSGGKNE